MAGLANPRVPKYHRIADTLREQIRRGDLAPGAKLPAETAIAQEHDTSVPTVRQAMTVLRAEGLIESKHGIGTFVRTNSRLQRRSRNRYGQARGRTGLLNNRFRHDIVSAGPEEAPANVAELMGLDEGAEVIVRRRDLYDEEGQLQEIGASYLPSEWAAGTYLANLEVVPKALFRCVEDLTGRRYSRATDHWIARPATQAETDRFDLALGSYVLHVTHVATDELGQVLEVSESIWPADRVTLIDDYDIPAEAEPDPAAGSDL